MDIELGPHPVGQALLRLIPKGEVAAQFRAEMFERQQRRADAMRDAATEDVSVEELFEQIRCKEEVAEMFRIAVEAAMASASHQQIRLLGRALSSGALAADRAAVDEAGQLLRVASELDPIDVRALVCIDAWEAERRGLMSSPHRFLRERLDASAAAVDTVAARLERLGLLESERTATVTDADEQSRLNDSIEVYEEWRLTSAAVALLALLKEPAD